MINIDKLDKKYMSDEVITKDDLSGASVEEVVDILKTIGLISWSAEEYGESGYLNPDKEILFANWNYLEDDVREILEESGYSTEWDDEWIVANDGKAYRTVGNQIGWMPYWFAYESEVYPIKGNEELFVESITNNPKNAAPEWLDLEKLGFEKAIDSDLGWYEQCKNISPKEIADKYAKGKDYVFQIDDLDPWCAEFSLWIKKEKKEDK